VSPGNRPLLALAWLGAVAAATAQQPAMDAAAVLATASWQQTELGLGVALRRAWLPALFGRPQCLCVLRVDRREPDVRLDLVLTRPRALTSTVAADRGAIAAVNGGFFLPDGSPRGLRRIDGIDVSTPESAERAHAAAVGWTADSVRFATSRADWTGWTTALEAGPQLVTDGRVLDHGERQRAIRHPRTALGVDGDGVVLLVTADGRTPPAAGLTFEELGHVMAALGCRSAINLDGGGSTTCWATGFTAADGSHIANHPCDDRAFDAAGERAVADMLLVHAPAVVVLDEAHVAATEGPVQWGTDGTGYLGAGFLWAPAGATVRVHFAGVVPRSGRWRVERRTVVAAGLDHACASFGGSGAERELAAAAAHCAAAGGPWVAIDSVQARAGDVVAIRAQSTRAAPFVVDALRLVEQPE
jgi:hypothetical protein